MDLIQQNILPIDGDITDISILFRFQSHDRSNVPE